MFLILYFRDEIARLLEAITKRLESGAALRFGPVEIGELKKEVASVRKELSDVNDKISKLFLATMAPGMYFNLKKLWGGHFGPYKKTKALERELYHLRDIGYVDIGAIASIPEADDDLSKYVKVTETGMLFVELREMIAKELSNTKHVAGNVDDVG